MVPKPLIVGACLLALTGCGGEKDRVTGDPRVSVVDPTETTEPNPDGDTRATLMLGLFTYMADAAIFDDCDGGFRYPVAMEADYISAERAYLEARTEPGASLLVTFEGRVAPRPPMEGGGAVDMIVIDRFIAVHPGESCDGEKPIQ